MELLGGVYQIINQMNGKRYIGSTVSFRRRWAEHLKHLRHGVHANRHLGRSFERYGEAAFIFSVLEPIDNPCQFIVREQHYLDMLKPEYNILPMAGSPLGCHRSSETCMRMSEAAMGHRVSRETRRKISAALKGRTLSEEHRRKLSEANAGKHLSKEHRRKISEAHKGKRHSEETRAKMSEARRGPAAPFYGRHHSEETCRKISEATKGIRPSESVRQKMSEAHMGKRHSEATKQKLSTALKAYWRRIRAARSHEETTDASTN